MVGDVRRHDADKGFWDCKVCDAANKKPDEYKYACCNLPVYSLIVFNTECALHKMTLFIIKITIRKLAEFRLNNSAKLDGLLNYVSYVRL